MKVRSNANSIATTILQKKSTQALYLALKDSIEKNHETVFSTHFQNYVTRLGLILSSCLEEPTFNDTKNAYYQKLISYICMDVLNNRQWLKVFKDVVNANDNANNVKHTLKDAKIDIKFVVGQYNGLIREIIKQTNITAFKMCYLSEDKAKNIRDEKIISEKNSVKYGQIANIKYEIRLSPEYQVDKYAKKIKAKLSIFWPENNKTNDYLKAIVVNKKTNREVCQTGLISISEKGKYTIDMILKESELDRRLLDLEVTLKHIVKEENSYTTGALFWKKEHSTVIDVEKNTTKISVSQVLKTEYTKD